MLRPYIVLWNYLFVARKRIFIQRCLFDIWMQSVRWSSLAEMCCLSLCHRLFFVFLTNGWKDKKPVIRLRNLICPELTTSFCLHCSHFREKAPCKFVTFVIFTLSVYLLCFLAFLFMSHRMPEMWTVVTDVPVVQCVCLSVCHTPVPCKSSSRDAGRVYGGDSLERKEHCYRLSPDSFKESMCLCQIPFFIWSILVYNFMFFLSFICNFLRLYLVLDCFNFFKFFLLLLLLYDICAQSVALVWQLFSHFAWFQAADGPTIYPSTSAVSSDYWWWTGV